MNIRKWIVYYCCVFAGLIFLAHNFIPHIHHDGGICFIHIFGNQETDCCHHDSDHTGEHQHGPFENCKLNDLQIRPESNKSITPDLTDQFLLVYHLLFLPPVLDPVENTVETELTYKPYFLFYSSVLIGSNYSLRAPPVSFII